MNFNLFNNQKANILLRLKILTHDIAGKNMILAMYVCNV